jgi:hypothetical protein
LAGAILAAQQGKNAERISEASLSTVFARLRRWLVQQAKADRKRGGD